MNKLIIPAINLILLGYIALGYAGTDGVSNGDLHASVCVRCHGPDGNSSNPPWPSLAGQNAVYLRKQIKAYRDGLRGHPVMQTIATDLEDAEIDQLAAYYTNMPVKSAVAKMIDHGRKIFLPCSACHGIKGEGIGSYPRLAGQQPEYLQLQLKNFQTGSRQSSIMQAMAINLSENDIRCIAMYLGTLE